MQQIQKYEDVITNAKELFPEESYRKTLDLLEQLRRIVPLGESHKVTYLETLIKYVDGIINGDEIIKCTTNEYCTKYAIEALNEIIHEVHERTLEVYREQRSQLQSEVTSLHNNRDLVSSQVNDLEIRKSKLVDQTSTLSTEVSSLQKELNDLKANGLAKVNAEVESARKKLNSEIEALEKTKKELKNMIEELKNSLNTHTLTISKLGGNETVIWEPINGLDPIYNTNYLTIESYISSLKQEYIDKTGATKEMCDREFEKHCPGLHEFIHILKKFSNNELEATTSLKNIIEHTNWGNESRHRAQTLATILKNFKMPKYQPKITNIDTFGITIDEIPTNMSSMLREFYFQRIAIEAVTKQKIVEAELRAVIAIMKSALPEDFDYSSLLQSFNSFDSILPYELTTTDEQPKLENKKIMHL